MADICRCPKRNPLSGTARRLLCCPANHRRSVAAAATDSTHPPSEVPSGSASEFRNIAMLPARLVPVDDPVSKSDRLLRAKPSSLQDSVSLFPTSRRRSTYSVHREPWVCIQNVFLQSSPRRCPSSSCLRWPKLLRRWLRTRPSALP